MPLTNTTLTKLKTKHKPYTLNDFNGLSIHVSPEGSKVWYFRFSWKGKQQGISLGKYSFISLKKHEKNVMKCLASLLIILTPEQNL